MDNENKSQKRRPVLEGEIITYDDAKTILIEGEVQDKLTLANKNEVSPEVLYYLAEDESPEVRVAVASNPATPIQADGILVEDTSDEVRMELARKIARLLPGITPTATHQLREQAIDILDKLAQDQVAKIRRIISEEIKENPDVPHDIIRRLAEDPDLAVSAPILEYSPLLDDTDFSEIITAGVAVEAIMAISKRKGLSENIAEIIANTLEIPAVAALLTNKSAKIREDTLEQISIQAESVEALHEPLATRPNLSIRIMRRVAGFVASSLVSQMVENAGLDQKTASSLLQRARQRIASEKPERGDKKTYKERAKEFYERGMLNDNFVLECIQEQRRTLLIHCLAIMADITDLKVEEIMSSQNGKSITALSWKAGLKMRTAIEVQKKIAGVTSLKLVMAKDGIDYPFSEEDLNRELLFYIG